MKIAAVASLLLVLATASPASADAGATRMRQPEAAGSHCTAEMKPTTARRLSTAASIPAHVECFDTFADSFEAATGLRLKDDVHPWQLTDSAMLGLATGDSQLLSGETGSAASSGQTVVGIDWSSTLWQGSSFTRTVSNSNGCRYGATYSLVYPSGWQDAISSVKNYQYCGTRYWEQSNFAGTSYTCGAFNNCGSLGAMDNQARSVKASDY